MSKLFSTRSLLSFLSLFVVLTSCSVYSFTGASIPPDVRTVTINNFTNQSANGNSRVAQNLTDQLKDRLLNETNLNLVKSGGDVEFSGIITKYEVKGQAPTADQFTASNRLTITVKVKFTNLRNDKQNWEQSFSRYDDYENSKNLSDVESILIASINNQIAEQIFDKAFVNW